jgi:hypothetical protein
MKLKAPIFLLLLLAGCQSIGTQYVPPDEGQDYALFLGGGFLINQFDKKGCYSGRTMVTEDVRLHAGKEVVIAVEDLFNQFRGGDRHFCRVIFSFVPKKNEQYELIFDNSKQMPAKNLFGNIVMSPVCTGGVAKLNDDGSKTPVIVTGLKLSQKKIMCIKVLPLVPPTENRQTLDATSRVIPSAISQAIQ